MKVKKSTELTQRHNIMMESTELINCNVLFITIDSCRYDTTEMANIPNLRSIGQILKAKSPATYTLPSHISFFVGYLPYVEHFNPPLYYSSEIRQLWRLNTARIRNPKTVGLLLNGETILEGYRKMGYKVIGGGGTGWFNSKILQSMFDVFHYVGPFNHNNIWRPRKKSEFISTHVDKLVYEAETSDRWFLFLNCAETHAPYDIGDSLSQELIDFYNYAYLAWGNKPKKAKEIDLTIEKLKPVHQQQVKALEILDQRIGVLIDKLPKDRPIITVICGDHGEGFGENFIWGHGATCEEVLSVPLVIGLLN